MKDNPIDEVRNYWNARPCNIRHSPAPTGTREYFDQVESRKYKVEPHIPDFAEFDKWKGKSVLEIGCGGGQWSKYMYDYVEKLYCVDILSAEHNKFWENVGNRKKDKINYATNMAMSVVMHQIVPAREFPRGAKGYRAFRYSLDNPKTKKLIDDARKKFSFKNPTLKTIGPSLKIVKSAMLYANLL